MKLIANKTSVIALALLLMQGCAQTRIEVRPDPLYAPVDMKAARFQPVNNGSIYQQGRSEFNALFSTWSP